MPDHYRTLIQSLRQLGFLFSRLGERRQEVWRNRQTDQEVMFDRREVSASKDASEAVVKRAKVAEPGVRASDATAADIAPTRAPAASAVLVAGPKARAASAKKTGGTRKRKAGVKAAQSRRSR